MCGIVGVWRFDGTRVDEQSLLAARERLIARGPDDAGSHIDAERVGLAHRRLSIIDLSPAGRMPMPNETSTVWGVFNGEIYNFVQLRRQLEAKGHTFLSHTDSEVIIHAYEEWGTDCFARFEGMFAVALWDRERQRMVLARDIAGEKPLYYHYRRGRALHFASTISALLGFGEVAPEIEPEAMRRYVEFGFVPAPASIIKDAFKVEPGTFVVIEQDREPTTHAYWSLERVVTATRRPAPTTLAQAADELHELMRAAVRMRLVSDVPLGAFLSGGVDSSLVVALMAEASARAVRTFTIGFRERQFDESEYAHRVAKHFGVENTTMVLSAADVLRELPALTAALDEPMADYSALPSLAVARLARRHVTVALTGDGADEAFGGYRYYAGTRLFEQIARVVPAALRGLASRAVVLPVPRLQRAIRRADAPDAATYFARCGFYRGGTADGVARILLHDVTRQRPEDAVADYVRAHPSLRPTEAGMLWDATHTLPDAWLTKVDRTSMAVSLETRAPFLDRSVLEYAFRLPIDYRVRGVEKKIVLREVLRRYLPDDLIDRPKQGFTAPMRAWFTNELREELHARLAPPRLERFGVFDTAAVQELLVEQMSNRSDHTQLLWALFHLDAWWDAHIRSARTN